MPNGLLSFVRPPSGHVPILVTMKSSIKNVVLVGLGLAVGCAAATVNPTSVTVATAQTGAGDWQCYRVKGFPNVAEASADAADMTASMNAVAPRATPGQVIQMSRVGTKWNYLCVKG